MRHSLFLVMLVWCVQVCAHAQEYFLQGHEYYQNHEYQKAIELYEKIEPKGCATLHALGNCFYHLGDYPRAYAYWLKAYKHACVSERRELDVQLTMLEKQFPTYCRASSVIGQLLEIPSWFFLQMLVLMLWYLFLFICFTNRVHRHKQLTLIIAVVLLTIVSVAVAKYYYTSHAAIVIGSGAEVKMGPKEHFDTLGTLVPTQLVTYAKERDGWIYVKTDTISGWVKTKELVLLGA